MSDGAAGNFGRITLGRGARVLVAFVLAGVIGWTGGCGEEAPPAGGSSGGKSAQRRIPPFLYLSSTDRLDQMARLPGLVTPAPNGIWWLQLDAGAQSGATYRVLDARENSPTEVFSVSVAALCAADGRAADAAVIARVNEAGWLWYRTAPAGTNPAPGGDFAPHSAAGEWRRYYPNSGRGLPLWAGYAVRALSPNLRFGLALTGVNPPEESQTGGERRPRGPMFDPAAKVPGVVVLELTYVVSGGVLRWSPLPDALAALPTEEAAKAVAAVGDDGALLTAEGAIFSAGPAGGFSQRARVELTDLQTLSDRVAWNGGRWQIQRGELEDIAWRLDAPPQALSLGHSGTRWIPADDRLVFEGPDGLLALMPVTNPPVRQLPIPVGDAVASLEAVQDSAQGSAPGSDPGAATVARHLTAAAGGSPGMLVLTETGADGKQVSFVYRWDPLR